MASDPALLAAARRQLALCGRDVHAFLGWWLSWKDQAGVDRDDLVDLVRQAQPGVFPTGAGEAQPPAAEPGAAGGSC